jgi:uncharacterized DUF497 family protein
MSDDVYFGAFVWSQSKNAWNVSRHGLRFEDAIQAFGDPRCIILYDPAHSLAEERFFCVGRIGSRTGTVRFTYRRGRVRIIGAGYWRKGRKLYEEQKTF